MFPWLGLACGLTYSCIAPTCRKWYVDRPGFAVSTGVMGFGLAAVVFSPFQRMMIDRWGVNGTFFSLVFSAFAVGALTSLIGSKLLDTTQSFTPAFLLAGTTTIIGLVLLRILNKKLPA